MKSSPRDESGRPRNRRTVALRHMLQSARIGARALGLLEIVAYLDAAASSLDDHDEAPPEPARAAAAIDARPKTLVSREVTVRRQAPSRKRQMR